MSEIGEIGIKGALPNPEEIKIALRRPTITPDELHRLGVLPVGRNGIYAACQLGVLAHVRIGKKIAILTAPLRRQLGLEA